MAQLKQTGKCWSNDNAKQPGWHTKFFLKFLSAGRPVITFITVSICWKIIKKTPAKYAARVGRHHDSNLLCRRSSHQPTQVGTNLLYEKAIVSFFYLPNVWLPLIRESHIPTSGIDISRTGPQKNQQRERLFYSLPQNIIVEIPWASSVLCWEQPCEY